MSSQVRVPDSRIEGFILLSKLSEDAFKELYSELAKHKKGFYRNDFQHQVVSSLEIIPKTDALKIIAVVFSLFSPLVSTGKDVNELISDLLLSLETNPRLTDPLSEVEKNNLHSYLTKFLRLPSLAIHAKALSVFFENERSFTSCRVISDVRPVFGLEDDSISGVLLTHTLKIEYASSDGGDEEFFVTLDSADIDDLISKLEREKRKGEKIKKMLSEGAIDLIEVSE